MEKEKRKIRACVLIVLMAAVITGFIYYWQRIRPVEITEGVLISIMGEVGEGQSSYESE